MSKQFNSAEREAIYSVIHERRDMMWLRYCTVLKAANPLPCSVLGRSKNFMINPCWKVKVGVIGKIWMLFWEKINTRELETNNASE